MNIFITGGTGFVGSHLINKLLNNNHVVFALVRNPQKLKITHPNLHLIKGDLSSDFNLPSVDEIDVVIHTAGIVHSYNTSEFYDVNLEGTKNIIQKFLPNNYLRFILISSLAARGPIEDCAIDMPVSHYGKSKLMAENYLNEIGPSTWVKTIIRPPMVIGPKDTAVLDVFKMVKDGIILLPGMNSKNKQYSFVCVFDLVETIYRSMQNSSNALIYSTHPTPITFAQLIKTIQLKLNKKNIYYLRLPNFLISFAAHLLFFINKLIAHQLRLTPDKTNELFPAKWIISKNEIKNNSTQNYQYDLEQTIAITLEDYRQNKWI